MMRIEEHQQVLRGMFDQQRELTLQLEELTKQREQVLSNLKKVQENIPAYSRLINQAISDGLEEFDDSYKQRDPLESERKLYELQIKKLTQERDLWKSRAEAANKGVK